MKYENPELHYEAQELFTRMWFDVRAQKQQSVANGACSYRDLFSDQIERHLPLVLACRCAHDLSSSIDAALFAEDFEANMQRVAVKFGLDPLPAGAKYDSLAAIVATAKEQLEAYVADNPGYETGIAMLALLDKPTKFTALLVRHGACDAGIVDVGRQTAKQVYNNSKNGSYLHWILTNLCGVDFEECYRYSADEIRAEYPWVRVRKLNAEALGGAK